MPRRRTRCRCPGRGRWRSGRRGRRRSGFWGSSCRRSRWLCSCRAGPTVVNISLLRDACRLISRPIRFPLLLTSAHCLLCRRRSWRSCRRSGSRSRRRGRSRRLCSCLAGPTVFNVSLLRYACRLICRPIRSPLLLAGPRCFLRSSRRRSWRGRRRSRSWGRGCRRSRRLCSCRAGPTFFNVSLLRDACCLICRPVRSPLLLAGPRRFLLGERR